MRPYVIIGAGAVGSSLGGFLARRGHPVLLVGRETHMRAVRMQGGIRVVTREEQFQAPVEAVSDVPAALPKDAILFLTVQSPDVTTTLEAWRGFASHPMVTWQNGVRSEGIAAAYFPDLYAGVVRSTSTVLEPGEVRMRRPGSLALGRWPRGTNALSSAIVGDLYHAGFHTVESAEIMNDKALKLLVNLVSGPAALLKHTHKEPVLAAVQVALLEEAIRVYGAAGIQTEPTSGVGQPEDGLLMHFKNGGQDPDTAGGVHNSTWQNLHYRRPRLENEYYHGEIIRLGQEHGIPTPVNARALELLEAAQRAGRGPETFDPDTFRDAFNGLVDFDNVTEPAPKTAPSALEI